MNRRRPAGPRGGPALIAALAFLVLGAPAVAQVAVRLDLNRATLEQMRTLPIDADLARRLWEYRTYERFYASVYDLMDVEGMTAADLERLKPLVTTLPPAVEDAQMARLEASYRQVRQFLGQEGTNEGLVDEYLDQLRDPVNVNRLDLFDLMSYQNVSPVDAANILEARRRLGGFADARQLRQAEGLRYYSFRNLRDFVTYADPDSAAQRDSRVRGSYEVRYYDTPYGASDLDVIAASTGQIFSDRLPSDPYGVGDQQLDPAMTQKLRLDFGNGFQGGLLTHRNLGERSWHETVKAYYGVSEKTVGAFRLKRLVLGNYRVAFGLGLIMDNTDFTLFRKTGYGWNVRPIGVRGDLSRTREFALTGAAAEGVYGRLHATAFVSTGRKDGILNPDGTINRYVVMSPRPSDEYLDAHLTASGGPTGLRREAFREDVFGGNLRYMLGEGTYVGVTGYETRYDRGFDPDPTTLFAAADMSRLEERDSEIWAGYNSVRIDRDTGDKVEHKFRRIYGADFQAVAGNAAIQGEYGVLQDPGASLFHGANRDAFIVNGYAQWDDLHLLAIYRDYDLGFDNPYGRPFSNDARYEQTLIDSPFRMQDDLYSFLSLRTPQPKPEQGLFLQSRYRVSRTLTITGLEYDQWKRKADGMDLRRYTLRAEYQPIFNLRLRLRHRYSSRGEQFPTDVREYRNWETRWELLTLLSNYNSLKFMYMTSNVMFPVRPRLSYPPDAGVGESAVGTAGIPAHAFQAIYEHNLTPHIRLLFSGEIYDGFLWNFEGNEFVTVDGRGFRNWFQLESRVSDRLLYQLKITRDHNLPHTWVDIRSYGDPSGSEPDGDYAARDITSVRMQIDYTF